MSLGGFRTRLPGPALPWLRPRHRFGFLAFLLLGLGSPQAQAQPFGETGSVDPGIPSPEEFLGYPLGARFTPHARIVAYLEALDAASDRVLIERYGVTEEGHPLLLVMVSDPANLARRAELEKAYARLADPRQLGRGEAESMARELPVAVWLSLGIHGNEPSPSEAALGLVYHYAAANDEATAALLTHAVVLIDPCLNPDGRERYVSWLNSVLGSHPDPATGAREHDEPWPGGRENHYLFDLNRDWAWLTQVESQARARAYLAWHPQVLVDFHEMWANSSYFFFPPERPVHPLYPREVMEWARRFGKQNAAAFDARGWRYFTEETFDLYYPGYGDTWPTFHGAVGMTYEQGGHSAAGLAYRRSDGDTLTLEERSHHHYIAALTTVETAVANRTARLLDFSRFFVREKPTGPAAYLFPPGDDPPRTGELVALLMAHGAEVYRAENALSPGGLHAYNGEPTGQTLPAGTYVVPLDQPLFRFLQAVLEPEPSLPDTSFYDFYDVSAWSLPHAFGIQAYWSDGNVRGALTRLKEPPRVSGEVVGPDAPYAYLISWKRNAAAVAAARLLGTGVHIDFLTRNVTLGKETFPPGSLVIFRARNNEDLHARVRAVARETGARVVGVESGLTDAGPDLGSFRVKPLRPPKVAVVAGNPVSPTSLGACWFLLDRLYGIPHSLVNSSSITEAMLRDYTVLVFPDDEAGGRAYSAVLDSSTVRVIRRWVDQGGVFVGLGGGAFFASANQAGLSSVKSLPDTADTKSLSEEGRKARDKQRRLETLAERELRHRREALPGTIFRVKVDAEHPLGFGYSGEARVLKITDRALELGPPGTNVAWFTATPRLSGYASAETVKRLEEKPFLVDEPRGRGHVVMYVEDPNFRLFWYGLNRIFLNSIFFLPSMVGG